MHMEYECDKQTFSYLFCNCSCNDDFAYSLTTKKGSSNVMSMYVYDGREQVVHLQCYYLERTNHGDISYQFNFNYILSLFFSETWSTDKLSKAVKIICRLEYAPLCAYWKFYLTKGRKSPVD